MPVLKRQEGNSITVFDCASERRYHCGMSLKELMEQKNINGADLARLVGAAQPEIWRLTQWPEKGGRKMTVAWAKRLAPVLGVKPQELLFVEGDSTRSDNIDRPAGSKEKKVQPPKNAIREIDSAAGLGGGQAIPIAYEDGVDDFRAGDAFKAEPWIFPRAFLDSGLKAPASKIIAMATQGDSMSPTINHGDVVLVDTRHLRISPPGIYALRDIYGEIIVKRLDIFRSEGRVIVKITSDNPHELAREEPASEVAIVGRVCGIVKIT